MGPTSSQTRELFPSVVVLTSPSFLLGIAEAGIWTHDLLFRGSWLNAMKWDTYLGATWAFWNVPQISKTTRDKEILKVLSQFIVQSRTERSLTGTNPRSVAGRLRPSWRKGIQKSIPWKPILKPIMNVSTVFFCFKSNAHSDEIPMK